jgi:hypothetical protein
VVAFSRHLPAENNKINKSGSIRIKGVVDGFCDCLCVASVI